jgi:MFS family permease
MSPVLGRNILPQRLSVLLIYVGTFFYWMGMYIYVQVLPVYAESLGASFTVVGFIVAAYAVPQFLLRIPIGLWSDYLGRQKPLIIAGIICVVLGSVGLGLSPAPVFLGISRLMVGIGAAVWVLFPIFLVAHDTSDKIGKSIGLLNFVNGAALVAASLIGGIAADARGERFVFFTAAVLALVAVASIFLTKEYRATQTGTVSLREFKQVTRRPLLIVVSIMGVFLFFAEFASIWGFVPLYAARLGASDTILGVLTMLMTGGSMIGSLAVAPILKRTGQVFSIVLSSLFLGLTLLTVPFIHNLILLGIALTINGVGFGILSVQLMVLSIYNIDVHQRSTAMGFYQAVYAMGMLIGPLISGYLSNNYGLPIVFYLAGALCLAITAMAYLPVIPGRRSVVKES